MPQADMESSSGLIMNVIRILTNSKDDAERDVIKKKLEDHLSISDQKLTNLVADHHKDLRDVMQAFRIISNNLQSSLAKLRDAKKRLEGSRDMLTSRLGELTKLNEDSKKNEKIISLLDQIDELSRVPIQINELLNDCEYLKSTKLLVEKQKYIEEHFESFDCMRELSTELEGKREEMYRIFIEKLKLFTDDDQYKKELIESLKLIDKTPELPELDVVKERTETTPTVKTCLFKFSRSSHAICFNEHYKEQIEVTKTLLSK